ncbi:hypothetical protein AB4Z40_11525 [Bosea sp. 2YAB26]|jgi:hypothetical protein|uniref:hypothetical protein n=1 Tax=unclassified Bosea (in: a-proteobacteria) TaxID=2653178 RepID=UPI003F90CDC9
MNSFKRLAAGLGISLVALTAVASVAEAQQQRKPLRVIVQKRSYLDPGNVVPVGSLNRYATQQLISPPVYSNVAELYGDSTLPPRIGAGVNPFRNTFSTPGF